MREGFQSFCTWSWLIIIIWHTNIAYNTPAACHLGLAVVRIKGAVDELHGYLRFWSRSFLGIDSDAHAIDMLTSSQQGNCLRDLILVLLHIISKVPERVKNEMDRCVTIGIHIKKRVLFGKKWQFGMQTLLSRFAWRSYFATIVNQTYGWMWSCIKAMLKFWQFTQSHHHGQRVSVIQNSMHSGVCKGVPCTSSDLFLATEW